MIEVFKTNVNELLTAINITAELLDIFPSSKIDFDLDDCDKILRIESEKVIIEEVAKILNSKGFLCEVLE